MAPDRGVVAATIASDACHGMLAARGAAVHVGVLGSVGEVGRNLLDPRYIEGLRQSKIVITCNPLWYEGDSRLGEALASGALVLSDAMNDPPPGLEDGKTVLCYHSEQHLLERLRWALDHPAQADAIAKAGAALARSPKHMVDVMVNSAFAPSPPTPGPAW